MVQECPILEISYLDGMTVTYKFFDFFGHCNLFFLCLPETKLQTSNWLDVLLQDLLGKNQQMVRTSLFCVHTAQGAIFRHNYILSLVIFCLSYSSFYLYVHFTWPEFDSLSRLHNQLKLNSLLSLFGHLLTVTEGGSACENSSMIFINKLVELPSTICYINRKVSKVTFVPISLFQLWKIFFLLLIFSFNV